MRTILMTIEYDGTQYAGWQLQTNGPSIQGVVESALTQVLGESVRVHSSGRTDAGVHARGMMAHFRTEAQLPLLAFRDGANRFLPLDVAVREVRLVPDTFHARFSAKGKWYRYTICRTETRSPLAQHMSWHLRCDLDFRAMRAAADLLVGERDFQAFRTSGCMARTTVRNIYSIDFVEESDMLHLDFKGSGFLRQMVRLLAGTLVSVGRGKRQVNDVSRLLAGDATVPCGPSAPAKGLCLQEVWYDFDSLANHQLSGQSQRMANGRKNSVAESDSP